MTTPTLRRLTVHPVKSLDGHTVESARIAHGTLAGDRQYAMVAAPADTPHDPATASVGGRGDYVNGKRTAAVHRLRSTFDPDGPTLALREYGHGDERTFDLDAPAALNAFLSDYFVDPVSLRRERRGGFPDDRQLAGPTVVSTATLDAVASWFPGMTTDGVRRRFRANVEIGGVPAFWEDRLYGDHGEAVAFRIGDVRFEGVNPCQRCVVPSRDPDTGEEWPGFRETFIERREATRPDWLDSDRFDHGFRLTVNTVVPESSWGETLSVGDEVVVGERHAFAE